MQRTEPIRLLSLNENARGFLTKNIKTLGWGDESIADTVGVAENLVASVRAGTLEVVSDEQEIPLCRLVAFLGISKDSLALM